MGKLKGIACRNSIEEWIVIGLAISVFLSIYATIAAMLLAIAYVIRKGKLTGVALRTPGIRYLWVLCVLGLMTAYVNQSVVSAAVAVALAACFAVGAFARSVMTRALFDKVVRASCAASLLAFAVALAQYAVFISPTGRVSSVFINANYYAAVAEAVILFAVYKLCGVPSRREKGFYAAVIALNAAGLYFSGCRTAVFALCAAAGLMLLISGRYRALAAFAGFCVLLGAALAFLPEIFPRMEQLDGDMDTRIAIWRRAVDGISKHPLFGGGALAYMGLNFKVNGAHIVHAHNIYLEVVFSFGAVGVALILLYLKKNLAPIWEMRRSPRDRSRFVLALGLLVSVALHGMVDAALFSVQVGVLLMLTLAMAGIRETPQPALVPVRRVAYAQGVGAGQARKGAYEAKEKPFFSKKSA